MKLKDVIIVSVSILLLNFSATLQCPSIGNCSSDANADTVASRLLRFEIASKARSSSRDSPTPTNTVDVSVSKKAVWNKRNKSPEFHVTLNSKEKESNISMIYVQVCSQSQKQINYETEFDVTDHHSWKVSTCKQQPDTTLITKVSTKPSFNISLVIKLRDPSLLNATLRVFIAEDSHHIYGPKDVWLYHEASSPRNAPVKKLSKRETEQVSDYVVVANEFYIHQLSLDGSRVQTIVSGLSFAVAIDFDFRQNYLFWTDTSRRSIMRSNLDGTNVAILLDQSLTQPEGIAVDWINNNLYWTDVVTRWIGVMDLNTRHYKMLLTSTSDANPREIVVDPTTRMLYWTEWGSNRVARIKKASMDGLYVATLHSTNIERAYSLVIDIDPQELYWVDYRLDRIEVSDVNGTNRRVLISSGLSQPFSISMFGNMLYISDWVFGIRSVNRSGSQEPRTIFDRFCGFTNFYGVQVISLQRQPLVANPCDTTTNGGCSHLCLLSSVDPRGYSCDCPDGMMLNNDTLTCNSSAITAAPPAPMTGSCRGAGHIGCCIGDQCTGDTRNCYCDADCYLYGDCCADLMDICQKQNNSSQYLVFSNSFYIERLSLDGTRTRTIHSGLNSAFGIDFNIKTNHLFWSKSGELWRSHLDGSEALLLLNRDIDVVDDIAVDWITNKLYWTDDGLDRIGVLDLELGYYSILIDTGLDTRPRGIIVDPINGFIYWCDWGTVARIERATMDGTSRIALHSSGLTWPNGLTLDHTTQKLYWIDASLNRIESSNLDGSNRTVLLITSGNIDRPFSITVLSNILYFTDGRFIKSVHKTGSSADIVDELCGNTYGIEAITEERQPIRSNPCQSNNGGCGHLCLLSASDPRGYACACHTGFTLESDQANCSSDTGTTAAPNITITSHGTCAAAGYIGCCTSGLCRGSPPTCSCDPLCSVFQDCCNDFTPCPIGSVIATITPGNSTLILAGGQQDFFFQCNVQSVEMPSILWTLTSTFSQVTRTISNAAGSLDSAYSVTFPNQQSSNLTINNVQLQNDGVYTCVATTGDLTDQASSRLSILVTPRMPVITGNTNYNESEVVELECEVVTYPSPIMIWIKREANVGTVILNSQQTRITFTYSQESLDRPTAVSRLMLARVSPSDNGTYSCQVSTDIPGYASISSQLTIFVQEINECERSSPCKNGGTCMDLATGYRCACLDTHTGQNCTLDIMMDIPQMEPTLVEMPSSMKADIATPINLTCSAEGYPPPTYQWYKDGVIIPSETKSFLYIPEALPSNRGSYSCQAINNRGQMSSDSAKVNISGVQQYIVTLMLNESTTIQVFEEALYIITNPSSMDSSAIIYAVQVLNTTLSGDAVFLVTTLSEEVSTAALHYYIQTAFESTPSVLMVASLFRYDGCGIDTVDTIMWPESNIGQVVQLPCPCEEFLQSGRMASRACGGTYSQGGQWMDVDYSQCDSVTNEVTSALCSIALHGSGTPEIQSEAIVNITSHSANFTADDVSITTLVIDDLTEEAIMNPEIRDNYLTAIDNLQQVNQDIILASEIQNQSSSRVLESLERFLDEVEINTLNSTENTTMFLYQTFALQVQNVDPSSFEEQTLNVDLGSVEEAMNITGSIDNSALITAMEFLNNATAAIHISNELLKYCTLGERAQRLSYSVFLFDTFFRSQDPLMRIGSLIIAARLNCDVNITSTLPVGVNITLRSNKDVNTSTGACTRWNPTHKERFGAWSSSGCREVVRDDNKRLCECSQLGHFGILFDLNPRPLPKIVDVVFAAITYIGVVLSLVSLIIFILTYVAIKKLRTATHGRILISMSCSLIGLYAIFVIGGQVTLIPALCGISSALLHYFLLVFFAWTAVEAVWLYLKLVKIFGLQNIESRFFMVASLLSWLVPILIVGISGGAGYSYYTSEYYCRATEWPFWFGLFLPLLVIYIFNWIMFTIIIASLCKHMNSIAKKTSTAVANKNEESRFNTKNFMIAIVLSITFGLGWGFGFLATSHDVLPIVIIFQAIFTIIVGIQGVLLFIFHGVRNPDVRGLWKSVLLSVSRKTRKVYSLTQSTGTSETKQASIPISPSTDMGLSHSYDRSATKSPSLTFSDNSIATADTNIDFEANPAYGNVKHYKPEEGIALDTNVAYEVVKQDLSLQGNVYETPK